MAQKKFSSMSNKKLNSLLETANDEDKALIQKELNKRASATAAPTTEPEVGSPSNPDVEVAPVTEDEQKVLDNAEVNAEAQAKAAKMTDEERHELAEKLRTETLNHRCEVVPFNTIEWVLGTIVGIIEEKRSNKVMYAVRTDDGRRIVKAYGSNLLRILDETVEPAKRGRSNKATQLDENGNPVNTTTADWTDEEIEEAIKAVISNVGKTISYPKTGALGVEVEGETETGRIVSLVPNKRQKTILYRIEVDQLEGVTEKKYAHKVTSNESLVLAEELDEAGKAINEKFTVRRYKEVAEAAALTPEEAFKTAEASLNKAKEQLERQKMTVAKREEAYLKAKEAYEASLANDGIASAEAPEIDDLA